MHILVVEDEPGVGSFLGRALRENAHVVDVAATGETGLELATGGSYDAILLDILLPGINGIEVCRRLRRAGVQVPVLMLTARSLVEQRVEGLDAGADDYLVKPFAVAELLARLRALLRRGREVVFPKNVALTVRFGAHNATDRKLYRDAAQSVPRK